MTRVYKVKATRTPRKDAQDKKAVIAGFRKQRKARLAARQKLRADFAKRRPRRDADDGQWITLPGGNHILLGDDGRPADPTWRIRLASTKDTDKNYKAVTSYLEKYDLFGQNRQGDVRSPEAGQTIYAICADYEELLDIKDGKRDNKLDFDTVYENLEEMKYYCNYTDELSAHASRDISKFCDSYQKLLDSVA